jgi:hypothetical protein
MRRQSGYQEIRPFKSRTEPTDVASVSAQIRHLAWGNSGDPSDAMPTSCPDYTFFTDDQLTDERDRQEAQLDQLAARPAASLIATGRRARIEVEVESMTAELRRRARSRHPSSRALNDRMQPLRLLSGSSDPD